MRMLAALLVVASATSCSDPHRLLVRLVTDFAPAREFSTVRVEILQNVASLHTSSVDALTTLDYRQGVSLAETFLESGTYDVVVTLLDAAGAPVIQRVARAQLNTSRAITLVISRSCLGVSCPAAGEDPALVACVGGQCVDPQCTVETPEYCAPECMRNEDCDTLATPECVETTCTSGACLALPRDDRCADTQTCEPTFGCTGGAVVLASPLARFPWNGYRTRSVREVIVQFRLVWDTVVSATSYEVQVDSDVTFAAPLIERAGPDTWLSGIAISALPIASEPPFGARYWWRVRACDAASCSDWSAARYFDHVRAPADLNGDGISEVAIASPGSAASSGNVTVGPGLLDPIRLRIVPVTAGAHRLGESLSWGDFDGDGYDDLLVGAPGTEVTSGEAYVHFGGAEGVSAVPDLTFTPTTPETGFGRWVAGVGDLDGNGTDDVAIGSPEGGGGTGAIVLLFNVVGRRDFRTRINTAGPNVEVGGRFGVVAPVGDLDGDGTVELAVGVPGDGAGSVRVFYGVPDLGNVDHVQVTLPGATEAATFGAAISGGDVDGDGFSDLVIGAPLFDGVAPDAGGAWVCFGGRSLGGLSPTPIPVSGLPPDAEFGAVLSVGDLNFDGFADVAVGAPGSGEGQVFLFWGAADRSFDTPIVIDSFTNLSADGARFGGALSATLDTNGNRVLDLVVGASEAGVDSGGVIVRAGSAGIYRGGPAAAWTMPDQRAQVAEPGAQYGFSVL